MININELTPTLKEVIVRKAEERGISLNAYILNMDKNYCILNEETGKVLEWNNGRLYDYVVYANLSCAKYDLGANESIITEDKAVLLLNEKDKN